MNKLYETLKTKVEKNDELVGVLGLGYVGLPLAVEFALKKVKVLGFEKSEQKAKNVNSGKNYIGDVTDSELTKVVNGGFLKATTDFSRIKECDVLLICVPTPLDIFQKPDMSFIQASCEDIAKYMRPCTFVSLESTTYPTTTEEFMLPILEKSGLKEGKDFWLSFSPERVDPGNEEYKTKNTPKVLGAMSKEGLELGKLIYSKAIEHVYTVSSPRAAEMVKILENTYRLVNISLINELALICGKMDIDIWEVIEAAKTKPYGFQAFYPGPGIGGHCIIGDEMIRIKNCTQGHIVSLNELFASEKNGGSIYTKGDIEYIKPTNISIHSIDPQTAAQSWKPITHVFRRSFDGPVITVKTKDNRTITVTDRHPMLKIKDSSLETIEARHLKIGDFLPIYIGNKTVNDSYIKQLRVDIIDELSETMVSKVRVKRISGSWKEYQKEIYSEVQGNRKYDFIKEDVIPLELFRKLERVKKIKIDHKTLMLNTGRGPSTTSFPAVVEIDGLWARLIGYYLSEGCSTNERGFKRIRITINRDEKELFADIEKISHEKGFSYSQSLSKRWKTHYIRLNSPILGWLITDRLGCGKNSYTMQIPSEFMVMDRGIKTELLKGLFRGDGDVYRRSGSRSYCKNGRKYNHRDNSLTVGYFSISNVLFHQVIYLLQEMGIIPAIKKGKQRLLISGYDQISAVSDWFIDNKGKKVADYLKSAVRKINKRRLNAIPAVEVKEVITKFRNVPVYSVEVADNHTFAVAQGIYVHNCIPLDPFYLEYVAKKYHFDLTMIHTAGQINTLMPHRMMVKINTALNKHKKSINGSKILFMGVAYKANINDERESPALRVIDEVARKGAVVSYHDPHIPSVKTEEGRILKSVELSDSAIASADCVVFTTAHTAFNVENIVNKAKLIVDLRNVVKSKSDKVTKL